ncbi:MULTISPECIES: acyl-CoA synthetase [Paraburkholderia]|uniref:acyl-CoA synthetase n=1 Tax=Paraburkholderia TaxID=1822464 RepID=UPI00224EB8A4|nr:MULTISPECIES: acyl-CoA synthetase [Paraburkholderia]MCX4163536.1 acyl-CoA synthetase [Paraburkholderia megapolitana]MDN7159031.1 acyl-CoA synthetase [Paraburkholderia sp. CHISQ3]MDQ6496078.1 acyl-CoA synthetase [Paraburkholderia megapolitana]
MSSFGPSLRDQSDVDALERTPLVERLEFPISSYAAIVRQAARTPRSIAITFVPTGDSNDGEQRYDYMTLSTRVTQVANALHGLGIRREDVVSYMLPNLPETHFVLWGAEAAGIVNPINPFLEVDHIVGILNAAGTRVLVAQGRQAAPGIWEKVEALRTQVPTLTTIIRVGGTDVCPDWAQDFDTLLTRQADKPIFTPPAADGSDVASYFHTGGTTGTPKLARRTHFNESANAWAVACAVDLGPQDPVLCGLPLFHSNAMMVTGLAPFSVGAHVVLLSDSGYRNPKTQSAFWRSVQRYRATLFSAVPTVLSALLNVARDGVDLRSLRFAICGAAPLSPELFQRFERASGLKLLEGYGMTEATCVSSINPRDGERRIGSIGLRLPYQEIRIVDLGSNGEIVRECEVDEIGTLLLRGPYVFSGYVKASDNKGVCLEDGWLNTGDLGRRDASGYFWLTGRAKDLIIRGGHNIDPAMIEEGLMRHPAVEIAAAVGIPDGHAGELPIAYVTLRAGASVSAGELLAHARSAITERAAVPVHVQVLDAMPLTAVNKIFKPALREKAIAKALIDTVHRVCGDTAKVDVEIRPHPKLGLESHVSVVLASSAERDALIAQTEAEFGRLPVHWVARWSTA